MKERRHYLMLVLFAAALFFCLAPAAVAEEPLEEEAYGFLAELAAMNPIPGFPPALFTPENQPSRFEIAYFLFCFDLSLAARAEAERLDLTGVFAGVWLSAHPGASSAPARVWAAQAEQDYRQLLLAFNREMSALGYRLPPDACPAWVKGGSDVPRH